MSTSLKWPKVARQSLLDAQRVYRIALPGASTHHIPPPFYLHTASQRSTTDTSYLTPYPAVGMAQGCQSTVGTGQGPAGMVLGWSSAGGSQLAAGTVVGGIPLAVAGTAAAVGTRRREQRREQRTEAGCTAGRAGRSSGWAGQLGRACALGLPLGRRWCRDHGGKRKGLGNGQMGVFSNRNWVGATY